MEQKNDLLDMSFETELFNAILTKIREHNLKEGGTAQDEGMVILMFQKGGSAGLNIGSSSINSELSMVISLHNIAGTYLDLIKKRSSLQVKP